MGRSSVANLQMVCLLLRHLLFGLGVKHVASLPIGGMGMPEALCKERTATAKNLSVSSAVIQELAGKSPESGEQGCGTALLYLGQDGCAGLSAYSRAMDVTKNLNTFLEPLQRHVDKEGRVHSSLRIKTTTGRLASSEPNLQQLPALEKDIYKIREAVRPAEDRRFIVADYGQLDLRVLAHMTGCKEMIHALSSGVDIHSAAACNMFPHVKQAVDNGEVSLNGDGDLPLLKDVFGSERRGAKAVNFGIAYGMGPVGLSKNLDCSVEEARGMIDKWYKGNPEVKRWQESVVSEAVRDAVLGGRDLAYVKTLRGRLRPLCRELLVPQKTRNSFDSQLGKLRSLTKNQATNAPIQGGSADIVVEAMLKAHHSEELQSLGYSIVLQIHDELIFEGPAENADAALSAVKEIMEDPFIDGSKLSVPLPVDAKVARTWMEGK